MDKQHGRHADGGHEHVGDRLAGEQADGHDHHRHGDAAEGELLAHAVEALLQRRVDEQTDLNIAVTVVYDGETTTAGDPPGENPVKSNTTGALSSTELGTAAASNTATITVVAPPTISKAFGAAAMNLLDPAGQADQLGELVTVRHQQLRHLSDLARCLERSVLCVYLSRIIFTKAKGEVLNP